MLLTVVFNSLLLVVFHLCVSLRSSSVRKLESPLNNNIKYFNRLKENSKSGKHYSKTTNLDNKAYADGITHFEIKNISKGWKKFNKIENTFKNMLTMKGVKFIYKRDNAWRTWRDVYYPNASKTTVFYKCSNIIKTTCNDCYGGGFWIIEEDQILCPYEILSMINKNEVCAINYAQMDKINEQCPSETSLNDLMLSCDNPIITMYRVTNVYSNSISERNQTNICGGRENCKISTFYRIYNDYILFRLINSSNDVVYSKIMKHDKKNYACLTNCGRLDPITKIVSKSVKKGTIQKTNKNNNRPFKNRKIKLNKRNIMTTVPCCRKLQTTTEDYDDENYDY